MALLLFCITSMRAPTMPAVGPDPGAPDSGRSGTWRHTQRSKGQRVKGVKGPSLLIKGKCPTYVLEPDALADLAQQGVPPHAGRRRSVVLLHLLQPGSAPDLLQQRQGSAGAQRMGRVSAPALLGVPMSALVSFFLPLGFLSLLFLLMSWRRNGGCWPWNRGALLISGFLMSTVAMTPQSTAPIQNVSVRAPVAVACSRIMSAESRRLPPVRPLPFPGLAPLDLGESDSKVFSVGQVNNNNTRPRGVSVRGGKAQLSFGNSCSCSRDASIQHGSHAERTTSRRRGRGVARVFGLTT
ncbi:hypothetical protein EYF80_037662 [Liparis tanakae]|uniref:Uncharacterized protein n=1 Tax=Liparis tanakae TaxID=230148 RepID=A0A4Z2GGW2_9TELE|nr:hypothetical protein EYF80_037662 [Liparis tanakae]